MPPRRAAAAAATAATSAAFANTSAWMKGIHQSGPTSSSASTPGVEGAGSGTASALTEDSPPLQLPPDDDHDDDYHQPAHNSPRPRRPRTSNTAQVHQAPAHPLRPHSARTGAVSRGGASKAGASSSTSTAAASGDKKEFKKGAGKLPLLPPPPPPSPIVVRLRQMWKFAAICQFLFTFDEAFGMKGFDTESLESDFDGTEQAFIPELMRKMLYTLTLDRSIDTSNWQANLRAQYLARDPKRNRLGTEDDPREWGSLSLPQKVTTLHDLCEWQLSEPERFRKLIPEDEESPTWQRIEPCGWDKQGNTYWLFDDNRMWVQHPDPNPPVPIAEPSTQAAAAKPPKKGSKRARAEAAAARRAKKAEEGASGSNKKSSSDTPRSGKSRASAAADESPRRIALRASSRLGGASHVNSDGWEIPPEDWLGDQSVEEGRQLRQRPDDGRRKSGRRSSGQHQPVELNPGLPMDTRRPSRRKSAAADEQPPEELDQQQEEEEEEQHASDEEGSDLSDPEADDADEQKEDAEDANTMEEAKETTTAEPAHNAADMEVHAKPAKGETEVAKPPAETAELETNTANQEEVKEEAIDGEAKQEPTANGDVEMKDGTAEEVKTEKEDEDEEPSWIEFEAIAVTRAEWEELANRFAKSRDPDEKNLHRHLHDGILDKIFADFDTKEKEKAMELALAARKRSSRIAIKESEKEERERDRQAREEMEARMAKIREEEEAKAAKEREAEEIARSREARLREREERLLAREKEIAERAAREEAERIAKEQAREERKRKREAIIANGGVPPESDGEEERGGSSKKKKTEKVKAPEPEHWDLACEVCGSAGRDLETDDETVACETCGKWQHIQCWNKWDKKQKREPRDWEQEEFHCTTCKAPPEGYVTPAQHLEAKRKRERENAARRRLQKKQAALQAQQENDGAGAPETPGSQVAPSPRSPQSPASISTPATNGVTPSPNWTPDMQQPVRPYMPAYQQSPTYPAAMLGAPHPQMLPRQPVPGYATHPQMIRPPMQGMFPRPPPNVGMPRSAIVANGHGPPPMHSLSPQMSPQPMHRPPPVYQQQQQPVYLQQAPPQVHQPQLHHQVPLQAQSQQSQTPSRQAPASMHPPHLPTTGSPNGVPPLQPNTAVSPTGTYRPRPLHRPPSSSGGSGSFPMRYTPKLSPLSRSVDPTGQEAGASPTVIDLGPSRGSPLPAQGVVKATELRPPAAGAPANAQGGNSNAPNGQTGASNL